MRVCVCVCACVCVCVSNNKIKKLIDLKGTQLCLKKQSKNS